MKQYLCACLSALLCGTVFLFDALWPLLWIAPALFALALFDGTHPAKVGFLFGTLFYALNSSYLLTLDVAFMVSPFLAALLRFGAFLAVALAEGGFCALFSLIFARLQKKSSPCAWPLLFSGLWVLYESFCGLSFSPLGYTGGCLSLPLAACPFMIQTASVFGMLFISFLLVFVSSSLAFSLRQKSPRPMAAPLALFLLNTLACTFLYQRKATGETKTAAAIQSGFSAEAKRSTNLSFHLDSLLEKIDGTDLIAFPEAELLLTLNQSPHYQTLSDVAAKRHSLVYLGAFYRGEGEKTFTSLYLLGGEDEAVYSKQHLVPIGEYLPVLDRLISSLREASLHPGKEAAPLSSGNVHAGGLLCFDAMFPAYARAEAQQGANFFCTAVNDSWFSMNRSGVLQLYHSVFRSVENGRWTLRSSPTGISAIIDDKGRIRASLPAGEIGRVTGELCLIDTKTPYTYLGDWPMLAAACLLVLLPLAVFFRKKEE